MTEQDRIARVRARLSGVLEERGRLAREVHDTLLQGVAGIALQLRVLAQSLEQSGTLTAEQLNDVIALAEQTVREARLAVWNLRSSPHHASLTRLLEVSAARRAGTGTNVHLTMTGQPRDLTHQQRTATVRIVQEAVTNAVRHGRATRIALHLEYGMNRVRLTIADNGSGFVPGDPAMTFIGRWGLRGMRERARALGGDVTVRSAPGAGTTVILVLPYAARRRRRQEHQKMIVNHRGG